MNGHILVYQFNETTVHYGNTFFKSDVKPKLSFSFTELICEPPTNVYFRMVNEKQFLLSEEEIAECQAYCHDFFTNGEYKVFAYDTNDNNNYKGYIMRSEALEKGYSYVIDKIPEKEAAYYDEEAGDWKYYYASINENGVLLEEISSICSNCAMLLTKEEFDALPAREHSTDAWDFVTETWIDKRDMTRMRKEAILSLRNGFEGIRWRAMGEYVPMYEQDTWRVQIAEAQAYLADNSAHTPYIDTFLALREDASIPTKDELVADIIANNEIFVSKMAEVNAKQWYFMKAIQSAENGYAIDAISASVTDYVKEALA